MKTLFITVLGSTVLFLGANAVFAHGGSGTAMGSQGMVRMMELMHGTLDEHKTLDCAALNDEEVIEAGEEMMESMMGLEVHERVEAVMTEEAHDNTHTMMGMWATGCIGDETTNALMERKGVTQRLSDLEKEVKGKVEWSVVAISAAIGAVVGWLGHQVLRRKEQ